MKLAVHKCSASLFSLNVKDSDMEGLVVKLEGVELKRELHPKFLGVMFDSKLTFGRHLHLMVEKAQQRGNIIRQLAGKDWEWNKQLMRSSYLALIRSVLIYGCAEWGP